MEDAYEQEVNVLIEEDEWSLFSYEEKQLLLSRLHQSQSELAQGLIHFVTLEVEEEKNKRIIDIEATLRRIGGE